MKRQALIEYRRFRNTDPPHVLRLWHSCGLGRGAALGLSADQFDDLVFAQPYFDPKGLILACDGTNVVGYVHAGFGIDPAQARLCHDHGVVCAVMVDPDYRRQGIGRRLVELAEEYLRGAGAATMQAGPAWPCDPFYFGIYGGSQPAGFLESDADAKPFFERLGYRPVSRHLVLQRKIRETSDPVGLRLLTIRRATQLVVIEPGTPRPWWWQTRTGRLDTIDLGLVPKSGGEPFAVVTLVGLDLYIPRWQVRPIGLLDLHVAETHRGQGYDQALLVEVCRRVRDEMVGLAEAHAPSEDHDLIAVCHSAGFKEVDAGVVYRKA
jgi:ribosomal protein S18 acetylase RimI-like enzyme